MKINKTNAMRILDGLKTDYIPHSYKTQDGAIDGVSVAAKTGRKAEVVFKTLVSRGASGEIYVFCIPVNQELNLKSASRAAGEKSIAMVHQSELFSLTGYQKGGCSPVGMKKHYTTFVDASALQYETILVSGGKIGLQIEINPQNLLDAVSAKTFCNNL